RLRASPGPAESRSAISPAPPARTAGRFPHHVVARIPQGKEPLAAAVAVVPPLHVGRGHVAAEEQVARQLVDGRFGGRPRIRLAAEAELVDLAGSAIRAGNLERHLTGLAVAVEADGRVQVPRAAPCGIVA